jgi:flagellar FliL protein
MPTSRILLIVILVSSLISLGGVGANYFLMRSLLQDSALAGGHAAAGEEAAAEELGEPGEFLFFPVQKIILSLRGEQQEHYFVIDLVLQADPDTDKKKLEQADPMVRSSTVAYLSALKFEEMRALPIPELQQRLEKALLDDFAKRRVVAPFQHVLVSKLVVQ